MFIGMAGGAFSSQTLKGAREILFWLLSADIDTNIFGLVAITAFYRAMFTIEFIPGQRVVEILLAAFPEY